MILNILQPVDCHSVCVTFESAYDQDKLDYLDHLWAKKQKKKTLNKTILFITPRRWMDFKSSLIVLPSNLCQQITFKILFDLHHNKNCHQLTKLIKIA